MANMNTGTRKDEGRTGNASMDKAAHSASEAVDKARDAASSVSQAVGQAAGQAVSSATSAAGKTADNLTAAAGSQLRGLSDTIREHTPQEGMLGQASQAVSSGLREGGKYLESEKFSGMAEDVAGVIRNHPIPALFVGIGIGFVLGSLLSSDR